MIDVTPFERLGTFENGWLDAHYHFSFAGYFDPSRRGATPMRTLRPSAESKFRCRSAPQIPPPQLQPATF